MLGLEYIVGAMNKLTPEQLADYESSLDNVAHEIIGAIEGQDESEIYDKYIVFRNALQEGIKKQCPEHKFGNF